MHLKHMFTWTALPEHSQGSLAAGVMWPCLQVWMSSCLWESFLLPQPEAVEPKWGKEGLQRRPGSRASGSEILNGALKHQSGGG